MPEETQEVTPANTETVVKSVTTSSPPEKDSAIWGVSVRAWIVLMLVGTLCLTVLLDPILGYLVDGSISIKITEPFYSAVGISIGYFFGQSKNKQ